MKTSDVTARRVTTSDVVVLCGHVTVVRLVCVPTTSPG